MITLEKMFVLKTIDAFKSIPDEILLAITIAMKEQFVQKDHQIIQKDLLGHTMYVLMKGEVEVHQGENTLAILKEGEVFGELAGLSPAKRTASVTARIDSLLLSIDHATLHDFIDIDSGLAKGIIQMLCRKIRMICAQLEKAQC